MISLAEVEGRWVLLFSCLSTEMPGAEPGAGGVWAVPVDGPGAPVDVRRAVRLTNESLYVGKLVAMRDGTTRFLAFENRGEDGRFRGGVIDPVLVAWGAGRAAWSWSTCPRAGVRETRPLRHGPRPPRVTSVTSLRIVRHVPAGEGANSTWQQ